MTKTQFNPFVAAIAVILVLSAPAAEAQQKKKPAPATAAAPASGVQGIGKGDMEFGAFANYTTYDDVDSDFFLLGASVGRFLTDSLELKITPIISYTKGNGNSSFNFSPFFSLEKLFRGANNSNPVVPYVGGGIGLSVGYSDSATTSSSTVGIFVAPTGGVKFFLSDRASLELALSYQVGILDSSSDPETFGLRTETLLQTVRVNFYY